MVFDWLEKVNNGSARAKGKWYHSLDSVAVLY